MRLKATFGTAGHPGHVGLAVQSGGVAVALTTALNRLGLGVSTVVSTGDALDVNGDDLLAWWGADRQTTAAVLYVEPLARPRQFARLARRLAASKPVLTVRSGSSAAARRAAASHTAGSATPRVLRDAGTRLADAHDAIDAAFAAEPDGGWLPPEQTTALATAAGLPLPQTNVVRSAEAAVRVWRKLGTPIAVKADVEGVLHKSAAGGVRAGLTSRAQIVAAVRDFRARFGSGAAS